MNKVYPDSSVHNVKFMQTNQTSGIIYGAFSAMLCLRAEGLDGKDTAFHSLCHA